LSTQIPVRVLTSYLDTKHQQELSGLDYAFSAYAITNLNESLQPYMSREWALAPFEPATLDLPGIGSENLTTSTKLYGIDLDCDVIPLRLPTDWGYYWNDLTNVPSVGISWKVFLVVSMQ
jgi:hypothetical protein